MARELTESKNVKEKSNWTKLTELANRTALRKGKTQMPGGATGAGCDRTGDSIAERLKPILTTATVITTAGTMAAAIAALSLAGNEWLDTIDNGRARALDLALFGFAGSAAWMSATIQILKRPVHAQGTTERTGPMARGAQGWLKTYLGRQRTKALEKKPIAWRTYQALCIGTAATMAVGLLGTAVEMGLQISQGERIGRPLFLQMSCGAFIAWGLGMCACEYLLYRNNSE